MEAVGLQTFIWNNNLRSGLLLAGFPVLLLGLVYVFTWAMIGAGYLPSAPEGPAVQAFHLMAVSAPLAIAAAAIWFVIAYFANQAIIDAATGARVVERRDEPELYNLLENLCISRGMKTPTLRIIESEALNAYATGLHEGQYSITVTRGIMQALDRDEMEAVLGHELTHVINRDVRTMVIAAVFAGIFSLIAQILYRSILWGGIRGGRREDRRGGGGVFILIALAAAFVGYLLAIVIRMALSRRREFVADAGSVELTKNPDAMISALMKISGGAEKLNAPESVRAMFLDDHESGIYALFATHPPIPDRIDALVRYAGGKLPQVQPEPAVTEGPWGGARKGPWG
jgi:heat shock protein HtpX